MSGYGTDPEFNAWLADNGYVLPEGAPTPAVLRQRGSAYVDGAYASRFPGQPADGYSQERQWPRIGAVDRFGNAIPSDLIPDAVIKASYQAAYLEATKPGSLSAVISGNKVISRVKAGSVEVEYAAADESDTAKAATPVVTAIEGLLANLLTWPMPAVLVV